MEGFIKAQDIKQACIREGCESQELEIMKDANGNDVPAKKCKKCGLISTMFKSVL